MRVSTKFSKFFISEIIAVLINTIFWVILAWQVEPGEYGEIQFLVGIASIASTIGLVGAGPTMAVSLAKKVPIQSNLILLSITMGGILFPITYFIFNRYDIGTLLYGMIFFQLSVGILQGKQEYSRYFNYVIAQKIIFVVAAEVFLFLFGIEFIIFAFSISYIIFINILLKEFRVTNLDMNLVKEKSFFVLNNYIITLFSIARDNIDKLIIVPVLGYVILGNYSLALQAILLLSSVITIINKYALPILSTKSDAGQFLRVSFFISLPLLAIGYFVMPIVIELLFHKYEHTIETIKILSFSIPAYSLVTAYNTRLFAIEKSKFVLIGLIVFVSILTPLMLYFGSSYGINGVSYSYVISIYVHSAVLYMFNRINKKQ